MTKKLNFMNNFKALLIFIILAMLTRPAYSIPTTIDELKKTLGDFCSDFGIDFCKEDSC